MNDNVFEKSSVIWSGCSFGENEYTEVYESIAWEKGNTLIRLSVCGDYTLFVNGKYVSSNQYGDFKHYKIYDEIDITRYLTNGKNDIGILVWYFGKNGMRYLSETPCIIYEIINDGELVAFSSDATLSRKSKAYASGLNKKITDQLGYSFDYDSTLEDNWLMGELDGFEHSCVLDNHFTFFKRPILKHDLQSLVKGKVYTCDNKYIADLGEEYVGLCSLSFVSDTKQKINVSYGELLEDGHVKRFIGNRDFSFDYTAKPGENNYTNYMLRLACRYIEIESEFPIDIECVGIIPQTYPVRENKVFLTDELDKKIYDICVNTLKLCMMEHYVDCPWREQCLYAFDSRNQMLAGYIAFEGGNFDYVRGNLLLMSKDTKPDNVLSICYPCGKALTIPSFSLYYILAVKEYLDYSGDLSLGHEVFAKLTGIIKSFADNSQDGLLCKFSGEHRWNFYDWSEYAQGHIYSNEPAEPDFLINAIGVIALRAYGDICTKLSKSNVYEGLADSIAAKAADKYYDNEKGTFFILDRTESATELANSLAVLSGIADESVTKDICAKLASGMLLPCSLSMKTFKYDAMLKCDKEKYSKTVLDEIRTAYKLMLDAGSTTVWETAEGAVAFDNAGSLCHGWSAIPIYYYDLLMN